MVDLFEIISGIIIGIIPIPLDLLKVVIFPGFACAGIMVLFLTYYERKLLAKLQLRVGPYYAGRFEGIFQMIADTIKLLFKEIIIPRKADKLLYLAAPVCALIVAASPLAVIPLSKTAVIANLDVGLLFFFAMLAFNPIVILLASWASHNKFSFIGGLRSLHQLVSYEIPLFLSVILWYGVLQQLGALVFLIAAIAELERVPMDIPEAEQEIATGWLAEYGGMSFGLFFFAVYIRLYVLAGLFTTVFLGGWLGPEIIPSEIWFLIKTVIVATVIILPRGFSPRLRIDQMLRTGWTKLLLLAIINIFIALVITQQNIIPF
jgi:NADH-quinone oxidoreductase subunit H